MSHVFDATRCSATQNQIYSWTKANEIQHICKTFRIVSAFTNVPKVVSLALTIKLTSQMLLHNYLQLQLQCNWLTDCALLLQLQRNERPLPKTADLPIECLHFHHMRVHISLEVFELLNLPLHCINIRAQSTHTCKLVFCTLQELQQILQTTINTQPFIMWNCLKMLLKLIKIHSMNKCITHASTNGNI